MPSIQDLMVELDGADAETVNRVAWREGSLPTRLAMLGLASIRKAQSPLWWGYPPGVFIGYKWSGPEMQDLTAALADHVRSLGYRVFLDREQLDESADAYFQIPAFITSLQDCSFYLLLLTEASADMLTARKGKTTWVFDEVQHAVRLVNSGRLFIVPALIEPKGRSDLFTPANCLDLTASPRDFTLLDDILAPGPLALGEAETAALAAAMAEFDRVFLSQAWQDAAQVLDRADAISLSFDHGFRRLLLAIYTGDGPGANAAQQRLEAVYGPQLVHHLYKGYCARHGIPDRSNRP